MVVVPWVALVQVSQAASHDRMVVLSRLQPERRISGWPASGQRLNQAMAERVPWTGRRNAAFAHPHTPYTDRATGLLVPVARNLTRFIENAIRFQQSRPDSLRPETP